MSKRWLRVARSITKSYGGVCVGARVAGTTWRSVHAGFRPLRRRRRSGGRGEPQVSREGEVTARLGRRCRPHRRRYGILRAVVACVAIAFALCACGTGAATLPTDAADSASPDEASVGAVAGYFVDFDPGDRRTNVGAIDPGLRVETAAKNISSDSAGAFIRSRAVSDAAPLTRATRHARASAAHRRARPATRSGECYDLPSMAEGA